MKEIEVVAAVILHQDEILCVRRGPSKYEYIDKKWEFPGGKIESGETREAALLRELEEELKVSPTELKFFSTVSHRYPDFAIVMHSYLCVVETRELVLTEHIDLLWLTKDRLNELDWADADIPIVQKLIK